MNIKITDGHHRIDLTNMFRVLELLANRQGMLAADIGERLSLSRATIVRLLADVRLLGVDLEYDRLEHSYLIKSWGPILTGETISTGLWRRLLVPTVEQAF